MPDRHVQSRLKKEHVIWLATVGRDDRPHAVPVWFWWDGESFR
jgi:nitroimidazol reductase NimA-like FMN-containing flavoprotein (pyridoxamine 5'-phosphate oxidase superfamily)